MDEIIEFNCRNCGCKVELPPARRRFLLEKGCELAPMFCDACFSARLKQIWEVPGEKRQAVCAGCGCETRLHFVPCQDRPVFCVECHHKRTQAV